MNQSPITAQNMNVYDNYHYLELCVIIHAWLLLVEVFFKGVHLEYEKNPYNSFYRLFVSKIFTPFIPINPIPHKIKRLFFY
jgi:hypothetical protein